jgi:hypothetical protein
MWSGKHVSASCALLHFYHLSIFCLLAEKERSLQIRGEAELARLFGREVCWKLRRGKEPALIESFAASQLAG